MHPPKGGSRSGRPSTNWLIETAGQAWEKYKLHDINTLSQALQERKRKRKKNITPEQAKTKKKRQQWKAREALRDYTEEKKDLNTEEIEEIVATAFKKNEITTFKSMQQEITVKTLLITLLNKYHEADEEEYNQMQLEERDKEEK